MRIILTLFVIIFGFISCNTNNSLSESNDECAEKIDPACTCITLYDPVCGCNDKTYSNLCMAGCANIEVVSNGECK